MAISFLLITFPKAKRNNSISFAEMKKIAGDKAVLVIGGILFFQSGFEGVLTNWTTLYFRDFGFTSSEALNALSLFVLGLTLGRVVLIFLLKKVSLHKALHLAIGLLLMSTILLEFLDSLIILQGVLFLFGFGSAGLFPGMIQFISEQYTMNRGTAIGLILFVGVCGSISMNYFMGIISHITGIHVFPSILLVLVIFLILFWILKNVINLKNQK